MEWRNVVSIDWVEELVVGKSFYDLVRRYTGMGWHSGTAAIRQFPLILDKHCGNREEDVISNVLQKILQEQ